MWSLSHVSRFVGIFAVASLLGACAHPISITPLDSSVNQNGNLIPKRVAYVMTDDYRQRQVETEGGGGDKVSYYPYRDLEKSLRDSLRSVYKDVVVVRSPNDLAYLKSVGVSYVFSPELTTSSSSSSIFTWPPTKFNIYLACDVTDSLGSIVSRMKVVGRGEAEFSEFKTDFGLAGRRAASDLTDKLKNEILLNTRLR